MTQELIVAWEAPEGEPGYPFEVTIPVLGDSVAARHAALDEALNACPANGQATIHFPDGGWTWSDLRHPEGVRAVERFAPGYFQPGDPQYIHVHGHDFVATGTRYHDGGCQMQCTCGIDHYLCPHGVETEMFTREQDCWDCFLAMMADGPDPGC